jgi:hypothetical protein
MKALPFAGLLLALAAAASTTGCASSCSASAGKLAALKRGMSFGEATGVMGCTGTQVTPNGPDTEEVSTVEWDGPEHGVVSRTQLDFRGGRLLSYTSDNRGGW